MTDYCEDCGKVATRAYGGYQAGHKRDKVCDYCAGHRDGMAAGHARWANSVPSGSSAQVVIHTQTGALATDPSVRGGVKIPGWPERDPRSIETDEITPADRSHGWHGTWGGKPASG